MRDDHAASVLTDEELEAIRDSVRALCQDFPGEYWRKLDEKREYPTSFVTRHDRGWILSRPYS